MEWNSYKNMFNSFYSFSSSTSFFDSTMLKLILSVTAKDERNEKDTTNDDIDDDVGSRRWFEQISVLNLTFIRLFQWFFELIYDISFDSWLLIRILKYSHLISSHLILHSTQLIEYAHEHNHLSKQKRGSFEFSFVLSNKRQQWAMRRWIRE